MKLATFLPPGASEPHAGEVRDGRIVTFTTGTVLDRLAAGDRTPADRRGDALADVTLLEPIPRPPAIFCIGRNYAAHIAELGNEKPEKPIVFLKLPLSSAPPRGPSARPKATSALDYETELVLVMGAGQHDRRLRGRQRRLRPRPAALREAVGARQGLRHLLPLGPVDHDRRRAADPSGLRITTHVNDELRQDGNTRDLIFEPRRARRLHRRGVHARAGRDHPHRHAERRRRGVRPAPLPAARGHRQMRDRGASGRSSTRSPELV